jgi:aminopeptidase YwaD
MKTVDCFLSISLLLICVAGAAAQASDPEITAGDLRTHIKYLASDQLEGRASGSEGNHKAAEYIARELERFGVAPAGPNGSYFQPFSFISTVKLGPANSMRLAGGALGEMNLTLDSDYRPLGLSSSGTADGPLVFAGYGISAPEKNYDDYAGIDVKGNIVVILRWGPDGDSPRSDFARHSSIREKARTARDKGAVGVILLIGPANEKDDELMKFGFDQVAANSGIPIVSMKRSLLLPAFEVAGKTLKAVQDTIASTIKPASFAFNGWRATLVTDVQTIKAQSANVIGMLEGNDQALKSEYVIIGAHFDHLGWGGQNSGSTRPDTVAIHHGADDNASGTAGLLELAQKFANSKGQLKRSVVFTFFSGEELGTLGSSYFVNNPTITLTQSVAMLNMDMIGRLENRNLTVGGSGTSPAWKDLLEKYDKDSTFVLKFEPDGFGPSDHSSFYGKNMPVLFFFTGTHSDYHKPSDEWTRINYDGEQKVVRYVYNIAREIDGMPQRPAYARVESSVSRTGPGDSRSYSVTLGIVPDFGQSTEGMKVSAVQPNRPGEKAGLKAGDIITKMAGKKVLNIYDYMGILGELKAGDTVDVEVLRDGTALTLKATMEKRK